MADGRELPEELARMDRGFGHDRARRAIRPELRRPLPAEGTMLRVRADLDRADPPIWRVLVGRR